MVAGAPSHDHVLVEKSDVQRPFSISPNILWQPARYRLKPRCGAGSSRVQIKSRSTSRISHVLPSEANSGNNSSLRHSPLINHGVREAAPLNRNYWTGPVHWLLICTASPLHNPALVFATFTVSCMLMSSAANANNSCI